MQQKHQVHNLIILDESGSMEDIKSPTIEGFNEIVQTIKGVEAQFPEQEHIISFISFNGLGRKTHLWKAPVAKLQQLNISTYKPDASTPLFDTMGIIMSKLSTELIDVENYNVLVTIFTDGEENASVEYSSSLIKKMVEDLKTKRWTFTYIGTNHDVDKMAKDLSISNSMRFAKNSASMKSLFDKEKLARMFFSQKIRNQQATEDDFYQQ